MDHVDRIMAQWNRERPDLDVGPMGLLGRLSRLSRRLAQEMSETWAAYGLNGASFDVLATLRRSGAPYALSPGDLIASTMVTSGTMTNRIDQLVKAGLVSREQNSEDRRGVTVALTDKGLRLIDEAVSAHVETQARLVSGLTEEDRRHLSDLLKSFQTSLD